MAAFAELGEKIKQFYSRYARYLDLFGRFAVALIVFFWIRSNVGWNATASSVPVILVAAVLCAFAGSGLIPVAGAFMVTADAFSLGVDAGIVTLVVFLILLLMFYRFASDDAVAVALIPVMASFGFTPLIPMICGFRRGVSSALAAVTGAVSYYVIISLSDLSGELSGIGSSEYLERLQTLIGGMFSSEMVLVCLSLAAVVVVVNAVRRMSFDYSFYVAAVMGAVAYVLFAALGNAVLGTELSVPLAAMGALSSAAVTCVMLLVFLPLDFKRSESLRFEDDDYYYYVKAVPKISGDFEMDEEEEGEQT